MGIHNGFPARGWVKLDGISVAKGGEVHIVSDFKTNLKYIYWSSDTPNQLTASNVMLSRTATRFLIVVNNKGESVLVPNGELKVSFDGNSVDSITEHIWGLHEKDKEFGNKFVSVEQNIDGITQTVGQTKEELNSVKEHVSKVEQKADGIDLSVKELNREYNDDKEMQALRERVNKSIIDVNSALGLFKAKITETFKDNEISEDESVEIQAQITILEDRKAKVIEQVDRVIALMEADENTEEVNKLKSQKQAFINAIDGLITLVNTSISDNTIVPTEITVVTDAFAKASLAVNTLKNTIDEVILLGVGGTISEELARIGMKSDEIVLSVQKVEETVENDMAYVKDELVGQIKDVSNAVNGLEETMNNSFLDGVLSDSEKIVLKRNLDALATEKLDIDKQYESIYNNTDLIGDPKTALKTAYDTYIQKYNGLVESINTVINKEGNIDINDQSNVNSSIVAHRNALGEFSTKASSAIDAIAGNKVSTVDKKYSEILLTPDGIVSKVGRLETTTTEHGNQLTSAESSITQLADRISSKVSAGEVSSIIEQSSDEIRYGFNNISDYVTIGTYGLNVRRGSIACDSIVSSSSNPIITLFDGNGMNCALDATAFMNGGIGDSIRLKRDNSNYIQVSNGALNIFLTGSGNDGARLCGITGDSNNFYLTTKGGQLRLYNNNAYVGSTALSKEGHSHNDYASDSHNHRGDYIYPDTVTCRALDSNDGAILMHTNLEGNSKNLGWSGSKFNMVSAREIWGDSGSVSDIKFKENIHYIDEVTEDVKSKEEIEIFSFGSSSVIEEEIIKPNLENNVIIGVTPQDLYDFVDKDLRLCEYNYTKEYLEGTEEDSFKNKLNFIAQDLVGKKVGELIVGEHEGSLAYNLNNYVSVIAGALQAEMKKEQELKAEVEKLKVENDVLKKELSEIKNMLNKLLQN